MRQVGTVLTVCCLLLVICISVHSTTAVLLQDLPRNAHSRRVLQEHPLDTQRQLQLQLLKAQQKQLPQLRRVSPGFYRNVRNDMPMNKYRQEFIVHALNCGGKPFTDSRGISYINDHDHVHGSAPTEHTNGRFSITKAAAKDQQLYQTYRQAAPDGGVLKYWLPVTDDGDYVAILQFADVFFTQDSSPVFDVIVNNVVAVSNLNINQAAGVTTAHKEYISFKVSDSTSIFKIKNSLAYPLVPRGMIVIELRHSEEDESCDTREHALPCTARGKGQKDSDQKQKRSPYICGLVIFKGVIDDVPQLDIPFKLQPNKKNYWLNNLEWYEADVGRFINHDSATAYEDYYADPKDIVAVKANCPYPVPQCFV